MIIGDRTQYRPPTNILHRTFILSCKLINSFAFLPVRGSWRWMEGWEAVVIGTTMKRTTKTKRHVLVGWPCDWGAKPLRLRLFFHRNIPCTLQKEPTRPQVAWGPVLEQYEASSPQNRWIPPPIDFWKDYMIHLVWSCRCLMNTWCFQSTNSRRCILRFIYGFHFHRPHKSTRQKQ